MCRGDAGKRETRNCAGDDGKGQSYPTKEVGQGHRNPEKAELTRDRCTRKAGSEHVLQENFGFF